MLFQAMIAALMAAGQVPAAATDPSTAVEAAPVERIGFGPIWLGMSFDEARTALPDVAWQEKPARLNPSRISLNGPAAIDLFGQRYDVEIKPGVYGASRVDFHTAAPEIGLRECRALVVKAVAGLEARFGRFEALPNTPNRPNNELVDVMRKQASGDLRMELPGFFAVSAGLPANEVFGAGGRSRVNFFALPGQRGRGTWQSIRQPANDDLTIGVGAGYAPDLDTGTPTCNLYIFVSHEPPRPEQETIAFEDLVPLRTPTIADRHASLEFMSAEQLAALPDEGLDVSVDCAVRRQHGALLCFNPAVARPDEDHLISAAQAHGRGYVFRTDNLQPESDIPLETRLTVRLRRSDRIDMSRPADASILAMGDVRWDRFPTRQWLTEQVGRMESGDHSIKAQCQVQADGSVICGELGTERNGEAVTGNPAIRLRNTGVRMLAAMRAAPELGDGTASAGRWFDFTYTFRVE